MQARMKAVLVGAAIAALAPAAARALPLNAPSVPVKSGTATDAVFHVTAFYTKGNQVWATGLVEGLVNGQHVSTVGSALVENFGNGGAARGGGPAPRGFGGITTQQAACDILTLDLGPLHLDLLGLVVDLSEVNLDIVAQPGSGNLLGNLLCAVAGLLDGPANAGLATQLAALLNSILGLLG